MRPTRSALGRALLEKTLGVHRDAPLPNTTATQLPAPQARRAQPRRPTPVPTERTRGKVALFATCYCNRNEPAIDRTCCACSSTTASRSSSRRSEKCCGMPKLELGDLDGGRGAQGRQHAGAGAAGRRAATTSSRAIPSCVLMFKQELPLLFPRRRRWCRKVGDHMFDPFEYLMLRHKAGLLNTDFKQRARQGRLPRALPPARAEHRPQDARRAEAGARARRSR